MLKIYNKNEFINKIQSIEGIILFGAGKRLSDVELFFINTEIPAKVSLIVDNSKDKQGDKITLWNRQFEISGLHNVINKDLPNYLILITIEDYGTLLDELHTYEIFKKTEITCFSHIIALDKEQKSMNKVLPEVFRIEKLPMIPKKIHYCWFGRKKIPEKYQRCIESWHKFCPDYEIIEWNESNYDISKCRYMQEAYQNKIWGFVPDYARIDIVYNNGGIYLDTDVELIKNIDDLLYQKGFSGFQDEETVAFGLGFGAIKGLPILKAMMKYYEKLSFVGKGGKLNLTASPVYNTSILSEHGLISNGEYQKVADMTIYPAKVLSGKCMYTMRTVIKPWTYAVHHYDGSWATKNARRVNARMEKDMKMYHFDVSNEE